MLKAILFDMDDTLIDWSTRTQDFATLNRRRISGVFQYIQHNIYPLEDEETFQECSWRNTLASWEHARQTLLAPHIGEVLVKTCIEMGIPEDQLIMEDLMEAYEWGPFPGVQPFKDALEVLPDLQAKGLKLGLVTNAYHPITMRSRELEAYGLLEYLDTACRLSAADVGYIKPHPRIFEMALEALEVSAEQTVFVGDSYEADIVGAQNVGMRAVLRTRSIHETNETSIVPDAKIETLHELYPLLDEWYPTWQG